LSDYFGHPEKAFNVIHVAGTNGKGSVSTKCAAALTAAGYRTGLMTSPQLFSFRERIRIDQQPIPKPNVVAILDDILASGLSRSFFEALTIMSCLHFKRQAVDWGVFEVGLGGRLDATNIVTPKVCVITSVSYDHLKSLGSTLEAITYEKAGIIKPGVPVVVGPKGVVRDIVEAKAKDVGAPIHYVKTEAQTYDEENADIARLVLNVLRESGTEIPEVCIDEGVKARPLLRKA
jgi:dihydrofolate synthase/folylpolyglutamate synthase